MCRALVASKYEHVGMVMLSVIADYVNDGMLVVMQAAFPGFTTIVPPFLCSSAKVDKSGFVVADMVNRFGKIEKDAGLYPSETELRDDVRRLADRLALSDEDRVTMFKCVQRWVVADRRLDPTFDPKDPDAKRLH